MTDYDPYWPQYLENMFGCLDALEQAKKELAFMNKYNDLIKESQDILNSFIKRGVKPLALAMGI